MFVPGYNVLTIIDASMGVAMETTQFALDDLRSIGQLVFVTPHLRFVWCSQIFTMPHHTIFYVSFVTGYLRFSIYSVIPHDDSLEIIGVYNGSAYTLTQQHLFLQSELWLRSSFSSALFFYLSMTFIFCVRAELCVVATSVKELMVKWSPLSDYNITVLKSLVSSSATP